ncbi:MAG: glutamate synthase-related protein [Bacillota bacterium]|nr:glutamate synthase-related protein [Bacillota bacterium]
MPERTEHDACALVLVVRREARPSRDPLEAALGALAEMDHRAGWVGEGRAREGDGAGVLVDLPRALWGRRLAEAGQEPALAGRREFAVAHLFLPGGRGGGREGEALRARVRERLAVEGFRILAEALDEVEPSVLGPRGRAEEPLFWQVGGLLRPEAGEGGFEAEGWRLANVLEELFGGEGLEVVSFSGQAAVYKVRGGPETLGAYYRDLADPAFATRSALGHSRYSTNTTSTFARVQPFWLLGHNGEINTVARLREEARLIGIPLARDGSDSQDLDRVLAALVRRHRFSLWEAAELLQPPLHNEIFTLPPELQDLYAWHRQAWGPYAQGPAALLARDGERFLAAVDALGLRPLWRLETGTAILFASEPRVVPFAELVAEPVPLAPGEKNGLLLARGGARWLDYPSLRRVILAERRRKGFPSGFRRAALEVGLRLRERASLSVEGGAVPEPPAQVAPGRTAGGGPDLPNDRPLEAPGGMRLRDAWARRQPVLAALGWEPEDVRLAQAEAGTGAEPIGSLGYDGPLAALSRQRVNLADFFHETVAVVTNPAIDREREVEHFSTRTLLGRRPRLDHPADREALELRVPLLLGGAAGGGGRLPREREQAVAADFGTCRLEELLDEFARRGERVARLEPLFGEGEGPRRAVERLAAAAVEAVRGGAAVLLLDDRRLFAPGALPLDVHLALAAVDRALRLAELRRGTTILVRSGALRNLHDLMLAMALGADALNPYRLFEVGTRTAAEASGAGGAEGGAAPEAEALEAALRRLLKALAAGVEKVLSTLGIHELRGYGRLMSSVGLPEELVAYFDMPAFVPAPAGEGWARLAQDALERYRVARGQADDRLAQPPRWFSRVWRLGGELALGRLEPAEFERRLQEMAEREPISLRHALEVATPLEGIAPEEVDLSVGPHALPFEISSMSFGSQGETAYRAYAEAAARLNMVALNGEGGEIPDLVGRYPMNRGIQVASGRFGVHRALLEGAWMAEIKIGQGAKPGEGGHLPGRKVSEQVARARNARPGVDLISPSNNHDLYSIEDLAELIATLKRVRPGLRVAVKVPVVPNIGTIGVGIAKAGADVITVSGFDGGTGAARLHAIRRAGLPVEIGVSEVHRALVEAGLRQRVEIWADGGVKSAEDVLRLMLLGANRCGFGTMAMVAVGCTACRSCQTDTCHVGIATQIRDRAEAQARGLRNFEPLAYEEAVERLVRFFTALGESLRARVAELGVRRAQELVGQSWRLVPAREGTRLGLARLIRPAGLPALPGVATASGAAEPVAASPPWREPEGEPAGAEAELPGGGSRAAGPAAGAPAPGPDGVGALVREEAAAGGLPGTGADRAGEAAGRLEDPVELFAPRQARTEVSEGIAPQGFGAFSLRGESWRAVGGAQDGAARTALGGRVVVLKRPNGRGRWVGGSVGKGFAYGAQRGLFLVQGSADARFGIRLSGADVVLGGEPAQPIRDELGCLAARANIKGFGFEYMTAGRAVVLGDPGPWLCSGMTGGVVYLRHEPAWGLDEAALRRRVAKGARVRLAPLGERGLGDVRELLGEYAQELEASGQPQEAERIRALAASAAEHFLALVPETEQVDPAISTE